MSASPCAFTHTNVCECVYKHGPVCIYTCTHVCVLCVFTHACMRECVRALCVLHMHLWVCVSCVCIYTHMWVWIVWKVVHTQASTDKRERVTVWTKEVKREGFEGSKRQRESVWRGDSGWAGGFSWCLDNVTIFKGKQAHVSLLVPDFPGEGSVLWLWANLPMTVLLTTKRKNFNNQYLRDKSAIFISILF